ncbi:MAG TPA: arginine deiminase-related protein [Ignavibacteria bacterium]|nr:amidinotransferase [Bacteroidota bacterium]HRI84993.1 arginine deiminase-related protein [Ignavibacteria bacterium]
MLPQKILMCKPEYFDVTYYGNEFMKDNIGKVNKAESMKQWYDLKEIYESLGFEVSLIPPAEGLVDMVFTANQSLPFTDASGNKNVILSKMKNEQRQSEVKHFRKFYENLGYKIHELPDDVKYFESMGDCVIDFERNILFGGYGFRTDEKTYDYIVNLTNFNVVKLKLINPFLYHLDTCFSVLNKDSAVIAEDAFEAQSLECIKSYFPDIIKADAQENLKNFVCNCHCPDGKNVIVQKGSVKFKEDIKNSGFSLIETETAEFIKSGGSVFCMKLMLY